MRHLKLSLGLAVVACSLAVAATPALAFEFKASKEGATRGPAESTQRLKFGPFKVKCLKVSTEGHVAAGTSKTYATSIKFSKCLTTAKIGNHEIFLGTRFLTPLAIEYHANGFVESGSELEEEEGKAVLKGGTAQLKVNTGKTEEFTKSECKVYWPEQTIPFKAAKNPGEEFSAATYSNETREHKLNKAEFPDGLQHFIKIDNAFKGIKTEFEGEPCEEWGKEEGAESVGGTYTGSFPQILVGGNLEYL
jgi:hypothetical protein